MTAPETERLRRYGTLHKYADGERLFETGKAIPGAFVVLRGAVAIAERDGLGHTTPIAEPGVGQFLGEVGLFPVRPHWSTPRPRVRSRHCLYPRRDCRPC